MGPIILLVQRLPGSIGPVRLTVTAVDSSTTAADIASGAVALMVGLVPRRIVPELSHFHWLLKINN